MTEQMTRALIIIAAVVLAFGPVVANADSFIAQNGLPYAGIRVQDVKDCKIVFLTASGSKPKPREIYSLKEIQIDSQTSFNMGERFASKGRWAQAVKQYDRTPSVRDKKWMRQLVAIRRLRAQTAAGMIDKAVTQWIALVKTNRQSGSSLALAPSRFAPAGSKVNSLAIAALKNQRTQRDVHKTYAAAISQVLMGLYRAEGDDAKAAALAAELAGGKTTKPKPAAAKPGTNGARPKDPTARLRNVPRRLATVQVLLEDGQAAKALGMIEKTLKRYQRRELPAALLLRGRAQMMLAEGKSGADRQILLLKAGLNFMRTAATFPRNAAAPQAFLEAARLHMKLAKPNRAAAISAYQAVINNYPASSAVPRARKAVAALRAEGQ